MISAAASLDQVLLHLRKRLLFRNRNPVFVRVVEAFDIAIRRSFNVAVDFGIQQLLLRHVQLFGFGLDQLVGSKLFQRSCQDLLFVLRQCCVILKPLCFEIPEIVGCRLIQLFLRYGLTVNDGHSIRIRLRKSHGCKRRERC